MGWRVNIHQQHLNNFHSFMNCLVSVNLCPNIFLNGFASHLSLQTIIPDLLIWTAFFCMSLFGLFTHSLIFLLCSLPLQSFYILSHTYLFCHSQSQLSSSLNLFPFSLSIHSLTSPVLKLPSFGVDCLACSVWLGFPAIFPVRSSARFWFSAQFWTFSLGWSPLLCWPVISVRLLPTQTIHHFNAFHSFIVSFVPGKHPVNMN